MRQRLFTLLLALIGLTTTVCAEDYGISIGGVQLTSDNYTNITAAGGFSAVISHAGSITYDPTQRSLKLRGAFIRVGEGVTFAIQIIPSTGEDYTIELVSGTTSTIQGGLTTSAQTYIVGGGTGVFTSENDCGIYAAYSNSGHDYTLYILGGTRVIARGKYGIAGYSASYGSLYISNSTVEATGAQGSICDFDQLTVSDCAILRPADAEWNMVAGGIYVGNDLVTSQVLIGPYSAIMATDRLNKNLFDSNGDGSVSLADLTTLADVLVGRIKKKVTSITLSSPGIVQIGTPKTVICKVLPQNATYSGLFWRSSNTAVATVDQTGKVTGISEGTTFITAYSVDGSDKSASIQLTVLNPTANGHAYVDLGLPSGTLWATTNVGATNPWDYGDYFAWGEYEPKSSYTWDSYKYGGERTLTKYCTRNDYGTVDNITELQSVDDAASRQWGSEWQMPSTEQWDELYDYTIIKQDNVNGVRGFRLTSIVPGYTDQSIFLPGAGYMEDNTVSSVGESLQYWPRDIDENLPSATPIFCNLRFSALWTAYIAYRCKGLPVRPVRNQ